MSNQLSKDSRIINPMSKIVLRYEVNDQMQATLSAPDLHPREASKLLMNMAIDLLFGYTEAVVDQTKKSIERQELERKLEKV